jgi:Mn-dependent DtxR family transcriptional regulator
MLLQLREALAGEDGRPVRIQTVARRLGSDPATVQAMLDHARRRGLIAQPPTCPLRCASAGAACRRCPLGDGR